LSHYDQILQQQEALAKWGAQAHKSGQLNREQREKIRKSIFRIVERVLDEDEEKRMQLIESSNLSRSLLDTYIHDYGNPKEIPDFIFDYLDDLGECIRSLDIETQEDSDDDEDMKIHVLHVLCSEWSRVASKILRISFEYRDPPMQIPNMSNHTTKPNDDVFPLP